MARKKAVSRSEDKHRRHTDEFKIEPVQMMLDGHTETSLRLLGLQCMFWKDHLLNLLP